MRGVKYFSISGVALLCTIAGASSVREFQKLSSPDLPGPAYEAFSGPETGTQPLTAAAVALPAPPPAYPGHFDLVGHDPLLYRGMNAAIAVKGDYVYVGSRPAGSQPDSGVMVVNVHDPAHPSIVGQIGLPNEGNPGESSRELRILPEQN